jgi:hypothetical protein
MPRCLFAAVALIVSSACIPMAAINNPLRVRIAPRLERAWSGVEVLPVTIDPASPVSDRDRSDAEASARELAEFLSRRVPVGAPGKPWLRLSARFVEYRRHLPFRSGTAVVVATFSDEAGQVIAEGETHVSNPGASTGPNLKCTPVEELGAGIVAFVEKRLLAR